MKKVLITTKIFSVVIGVRGLERKKLVWKTLFCLNFLMAL